MKLNFGAFFVSLLLLPWPQATPAVGAEAKKITLSYSAVSMTWFPVKVAVEKGFFRHESLDPQLTQMNGTVATVALANGHRRPTAGTRR